MYLTGKDGGVVLGEGGGAITPKVIGWDYKETHENVKSRAMGDRGTSREYLATDWESNITIVVRKTGDPIDISDFRGGVIAFALKTDAAGTPMTTVAGDGMVTETSINAENDENIEWKLKVECASPDGADLPVVTVPA